MTLARALRQHFVLALITFVVIAGLAVYAAVTPPTRYQSSAVVSVQPASVGVSTTSVEYLMPSIRARLASLQMREIVAKRLPESLRGADWTVLSSVTPGSGVVRLTVESSDTVAPPVVANAYAEELAETKVSSIPLQILVIDPAVGTARLSQRNQLLISGLGLALILACLVALARYSWLESGRDPAVRRRPPAEAPPRIKPASTSIHAPTEPEDDKAPPYVTAASAVVHPPTESERDEAPRRLRTGTRSSG